MSHRQAKRARQALRAERSSPRPSPRKRGRSAGSRRNLWIAGAVAVAIAAIVGGVLIARGNSGKTAFARLSSSAPVELRGTSPITGKPVDLASFTGQPVVINIWASWCTGCRAEARALARFERAHPEAQVIGIDTQDNSGDAKAFYREFGWTHPSVADPSGSTAAKFGLQGLPTTLFLDRQHRLVTQIIGETNFEGFARGLREAMRASS